MPSARESSSRRIRAREPSSTPRGSVVEAALRGEAGCELAPAISRIRRHQPTTPSERGPRSSGASTLRGASLADIAPETPPTRSNGGHVAGSRAPQIAVSPPTWALLRSSKSGVKPPLSSNPTIRDDASWARGLAPALDPSHRTMERGGATSRATPRWPVLAL